MELRAKTKGILQKDRWYHGTTKSGFNNIMSQGVKFDIGWGTELDFGPGFYLAPKREMAENFIKQQIEFKKSDGLEEFLAPEQFEAVVIEFKLDLVPYLASEGIKVYDRNNREFASFVAENRIRAKEGLVHDYPLVYGVMSDNNPVGLVSKFNEGELNKEEVIEGILEKTISTRQLSIHKQEICDIITITKAYEVDGGKELDINDYGADK